MKKRLLIIILIVLVLSLIGVLIFYLASHKQSSPPSQSPTPQPPTSHIQTSTPITRAEFIDLLPIQTPKYNIEYLSKSDTILVTIKESPFNQNKQAVEDWLKKLGVESPDNFNISWSSYRYVQ